MLRLASIADAIAADDAWQADRRSTDTHGWRWSQVATVARPCIYALSSVAVPVAALFGTPAKNKVLVGGRTRRLDYFQIAPSLRGTELGRLAFAIFARFAVDEGASELVLASLPATKLVSFYEKLGGKVGEAPGWTATKGLTPIRFDPATLSILAEYADALEQEA